MKFFSSSETGLLKDEQAKDLREARMNVNDIMQKLVSENDYGSGVELLTVVHSIFPESFYEKNPEFIRRVQFFENNKEADARLKMDFDEFFKGDAKKKQEIIVQNLIDSIKAIKVIVQEGFDAEKLMQDIQNATS
jgi:hypothetical protein